MPACVSNISYVKGIHNMKAGAVYEQTFLDENDTSRHRRSDISCPSLTDANGLPCFANGVALGCSLHNACFLYDLTQPGGGESSTPSTATPT